MTQECGNETQHVPVMQKFRKADVCDFQLFVSIFASPAVFDELNLVLKSFSSFDLSPRRLSESDRHHSAQNLLLIFRQVRDGLVRRLILGPARIVNLRSHSEYSDFIMAPYVCMTFSQKEKERAREREPPQG